MKPNKYMVNFTENQLYNVSLHRRKRLVRPKRSTYMSYTRNNPELLGTQPVGKLLGRYALPAVIAMSSSSLYHIIDRIFIGHGVGPMAISGVGITLPLMTIAAAFGSMVGVGASSLISIRLGQGNKERAFLILSNAVMLNIITGLLFGILSLAFLDPILYALGASDDTIPYARDFMKVILCGNIVTHVYLGLNEVLRASGYPKKAMMIMITAVLVNCTLNPLFIFVFEWGVQGSAFATLIAQCTAVALELTHFLDKKNFLYLRRGTFRFMGIIVRKVLSIGLAPFLLNLCASVVVLFINGALKKTGGDISVGAYSVVNGVLMLFIMIVAGLNQGMQPIVGYNFGARQFPRALKALKLTIMCGMGATAAGFTVCQLFPDAVAHLFINVDKDPENSMKLFAVVKEGLRTATIVYPIVGFQIVASNFFQYIGKPKKAIFLSMTRQLLFLVPLIAVLPDIYGTRGVWMSIPIADSLSALLAATLLFIQVRQLIRRPDSVKVI